MAAAGRTMPIVRKKGISWPSEETTLWRYMDLARFVSLLQNCSLYFPSISQLAQTDPYEGRFPYKQRLSDPKSWKFGKEDEHIFSDEQLKLLDGAARSFIPRSERSARHYTFVSCWHANSGESDAMWRLYSLQGQGIAIRTTFKGLRTAIQDDGKTIHAGHVKYRNYDLHAIEMEDHVHVVFHKRESFSHEQEVRLAYQMALHERQEPIPTGISVSVDLRLAIEHVFVSPATPAWVVDVVARLVQRYGLDGNLVSQSPLYRPMD